MNTPDVNRLCMGCMTELMQDAAICPVCGLAAAYENNENQLPVRTILNGRYLIGKVLGQGGFGITYVGWELNLNTKVAIKEYYPSDFVSRIPSTRFVQPHSDDGGDYFLNGRMEFVKEAQTMAKFEGIPGIIGVKNYFMENGTAYIVMDYIEGITLKRYVEEQGGKISVQKALDLLKPLFSALEQVHQKNVIHRDISPDNIMLRPDGSVILLDFGAARAMSIRGELSNTINVKHGFAPEEQYRTHGQQGPWTDEYALCATIYRITTGITPPQSLERLQQADGIIPPNQAGADFSAVQQQALLKGLSPRHEDRFCTIDELFQSLYENHPVKIKRSPKMIGIQIAVIAVLVAAMAVVGAYKIINARQAAALRQTSSQISSIYNDAADEVRIIYSDRHKLEQRAAEKISAAMKDCPLTAVKEMGLEELSKLPMDNKDIYITWISETAAFSAELPVIHGNNAMLFFEPDDLSGYCCVIYPEGCSKNVKNALEALAASGDMVTELIPVSLDNGGEAYQVNGIDIVAFDQLGLKNYTIQQKNGKIEIDSNNGALSVVMEKDNNMADVTLNHSTERVELSFPPQVIAGSVYVSIDDLIKMGLISG